MTLRVLTVASLYPNEAQPTQGRYIENRVRRVHESGRANVTVIAPVPWFPIAASAFGHYSTFARVPAFETRHGIRIEHPRFGKIPKNFGTRMQPKFFYPALRACAKRLIAEEGSFDVIDAHYFYPDAVASAWLSRELDIPLIATAYGEDINFMAEYSVIAANAMHETTVQAYASITVSEPLREALIELCADDSELYTLHNGVDLEVFRPPEPGENLKAKFGISNNAPLVAAVAALEPHKGLSEGIRAVAALPHVHLRIAGKGQKHDALQAEIDALGVRDRIKLLGPVEHVRLRDLYAAADVSLHTPNRAGGATVVPESLACGTPVVATPFGAVPEFMTGPAAGTMVPNSDIKGIRNALGRQLLAGADRAAARKIAERHGWDETVSGILFLFEAAARLHRQGGADAELLSA